MILVSPDSEEVGLAVSGKDIEVDQPTALLGVSDYLIGRSMSGEYVLDL